MRYNTHVQLCKPILGYISLEVSHVCHHCQYTLLHGDIMLGVLISLPLLTVMVSLSFFLIPDQFAFRWLEVSIFPFGF